MTAQRRTEQGTALIEFVWLALLLLVPLVYVMLGVFETQRTAYAASSAARSAGRAFLTAPTEQSARARAELAARMSFADQGLDAPLFHLRISCRPVPADCLRPGSVVTARVTSQAKLPLMPAVLGSSTPSIRIEAEHSAPYGRFRQAR